MTTDSEQLAKELLPRNGQVTDSTDTRLTTVRSDSPVGRPQLDYVSEENPLPMHDPATDRPAGHNFWRSERPTVGTTAIELDKTLREFAVHAAITVEVAAIRVRVTGDVPTATTGKVFVVGDLIELENEVEIANFRAIRRDGTSATLDVEYGLQL